MLQIETVDSTNGTPAASRSSCRLHLGPGGEHPAEADRSEDHRQREALAKNLDRCVPVRDVAHYDLTQQQPLEVGDVCPQGGLFVCTAVDVVEQLAR